MKFKLDENLGPSIQSLFHEHGHDCTTTREEGLGGADDPDLLSAAVAEGRIFVTSDHDFGNVLVYPPEETHGILVLNPPGRVSLRLLRRLVLAMLDALSREDVSKKLWIVEPGADSGTPIRIVAVGRRIAHYPDPVCQCLDAGKSVMSRVLFLANTSCVPVSISVSIPVSIPFVSTLSCPPPREHDQ